jgi:2'-5' RNA ligase
MADDEGLMSVWFVGVPVTFAADDEPLVPADADVRALRPADRHVTLVFLGRVPDGAARRVWRSLPTLRLPVEVHALGWDRFGRSAVALGLSDDDGLLEAAATLCHDAAGDVVVDRRRPAVFRPHVTMARAPRRGRPPTERDLRRWPVPSSALQVGRPTLFRSNPRSTGDRYEVVEQQRRG